jgi:hypothetical protein
MRLNRIFNIHRSVLKKLLRIEVEFDASLLKSKLQDDISNDFNLTDDRTSVKTFIEFSFIPSEFKSLPLKFNDSNF